MPLHARQTHQSFLGAKEACIREHGQRNPIVTSPFRKSVYFHLTLFSVPHAHPRWTPLPRIAATDSLCGLLTSLCFQLPRLPSWGCQKRKSPYSSRGGAEQTETQKEGCAERRTRDPAGAATPSGRGGWIM